MTTTTISRTRKIIRFITQTEKDQLRRANIRKCKGTDLYPFSNQTFYFEFTDKPYAAPREEGRPS
jgi:hypothetical protein